MHTICISILMHTIIHMHKMYVQNCSLQPFGNISKMGEKKLNIHR